jgi:hypothetical protein
MPLIRPLIVMLLCLYGAMVLSGCEAKPQAKLELTLPKNLTEACVGPDVSKASSAQDMAKISIDQEAELLSCEAKRRALVTIIGSKK